MAKISQVHSTLLNKQNEKQEQYEYEAKKSLEEHLQRLESHLKESYRETLKRIEKTMTQQDSKTVAKLERKLAWLGWERWMYVIGAFTIGALLSPAFMYYKKGETIHYNSGASKKVIVLRYKAPEGE